MAPVVKELASLPDQDIRAMAVYLGSFNENAIGQPDQDALAARLESLDRHQGGYGLGRRRAPL